MNVNLRLRTIHRFDIRIIEKDALFGTNFMGPRIGHTSNQNHGWNTAAFVAIIKTYNFMHSLHLCIDHAGVHWVFGEKCWPD